MNRGALLIFTLLLAGCTNLSGLQSVKSFEQAVNRANGNWDAEFATASSSRQAEINRSRQYLGSASPEECVNFGTMDIGAGFATAPSTRSGEDNDARGLMASVKAYPFGRWYGFPKAREKDAEGKAIALCDGLQASDVIIRNPDSKTLGLSNNFWRRWAIYYGNSIGTFSGGGLDSEVNSLGLSFDVSPELAIYIGAGMYDVAETRENPVTMMEETISDTDYGWVIGASLNLNAFKSLRDFIGNSIASGGD